MKKKLLITLDSGRFKAYRWEHDRNFSHPRLCPLEDWSTEVNGRLSDRVTDQGGQFSKGALSFAAVNDMADGERHNLDLERRRRALKSMAGRIGELLESEDVDGCYLAAPGEVNRAVLNALEPSVRDRVEKNVRADLTRLNPPEIISHFDAE